MPVFPKEIEVERIMNLVRGFGWEKVKEEQIGDELHVTVSKVIVTKEEKEAGPAPM